MTRDQASRLRELVVHAPHQAEDSVLEPLPAIAVYGGRRGVGTTTVAAGLAVALGRIGRRPVLVDANMDAPAVSRVFRLPPAGDIGDVVHGRRTATEVQQRGPAGIGVIAGATLPGRSPECAAHDARRLMQQLQHLRPRCDLIVLDAGTGAGPTQRVLCQTAHRIVLVTTPDGPALMNLYASIKRIRGERSDPRLDAVVNRCADSPADRSVHDRLQQTCQRFLGLGIEWGTCLPDDPCVPEADPGHAPVTVHTPDCPVAQTLQHLAQQMERSLRPDPGPAVRYDDNPEQRVGPSMHRSV